jgi:hypothetical protein
MLAKTQSREKTIELMGTSPITFANHYRVAMPPDWAGKYWKILPNEIRIQRKLLQKA